ncbi:ABC transporter substrate-binding protein [Bacillus sp. 2205SS5-2]|uniref:ABC transporter substrate-binding protein n=1 Tax=Bacillus sp. 2205SS5-2 TaxID=3109031 RepID=UPI0030042F67
MHLRKKSSYISLFLLLLAVMFALAACGSNEKKATTDEETSNTESRSYTVKHAMGTTDIPETPKKIVILTNEGTEALLSLGVTLAGAVQSWTGDPWYDHIAEKMSDVKVVGLESQVNVEAVAALKPDLIIGNKMRQEEIYDQLSLIAPTVFAETLRGNWKENFELYAEAVNRTEEGEEVISAYDERIRSLQESLGEKVDMEVSMVRFMAGDVRIYHKDSFSGVILEQIGFARPESQNVDDFAEKGVTKERIPAMDGDILFYFTYEPGDGEATKVEEEWLDDPLFNNLEVAHTESIYKVSDDIWNTAGGVLAANLMLDDLQTYFLEQ